MGAWSAEIIGNDTSADIYQTFFDLHSQGKDPASVSRQIQDEFSETFEDEDDRNNGLFALALAQWETKSLDPAIYHEVKEIIVSGKDIELWESLGADMDTIEERKTELDNFLAKISMI
jgi:hypothetical protein